MKFIYSINDTVKTALSLFDKEIKENRGLNLY